MSTETLPRIVGLTGGIASGKSTVSNMFRDLGVPVIDADEVSRRVVAPGSDGLAEIVAAFGPGVLLPDGSLDRAALGQIVFSDDSARRTLNGITHPKIAMQMLHDAQEFGKAGHAWVIYDAALLVENRIHDMLGGLIVVATKPATQLQRLKLRDGFDDAQALQRLDAQLPLEKKIEVADWVIDNDGDLDNTRAQVLAVYQELEQST